MNGIAQYYGRKTTTGHTIIVLSSINTPVVIITKSDGMLYRLLCLQLILVNKKIGTGWHGKLGQVPAASQELENFDAVHEPVREVVI